MDADCLPACHPGWLLATYVIVFAAFIVSIDASAIAIAIATAVIVVAAVVAMQSFAYVWMRNVLNF